MTLLDIDFANSRQTRILVLYVSRIGDTMLITPAVRALAQAWPEAKIDFIGSRTSAEVFKNLPFVHNVSWLTKDLAKLKGWLSRKPYDLSIIYGYDGDTPFVEYATRISCNVVAFKQLKDSLNNRLFVSVEKPPFQSCHAVDHFLSLIAPLGIPHAGRYLSYEVSENERSWAKATLAQHLTEVLIGLQVASYPTKAYRDWPIESFLALCEKICSKYDNVHFMLFGGSLEKDRTRWLKEKLSACITDYSGRLSLRQTASLMNELDLYIGVDTGPTHIMGALHRPMVALYHGHSPSRFLAPLEHPCAYFVDHPLADQNCSIEASMSDISVERVWQAVAQALMENPPGQR